MITHRKFTVIIPTRERADTLLHTLKTCVTQNYDDLTIIVSDNCSADNTREVVESFQDSRIKYVNPGERLSMSHHWEFALLHVKEGFVTILGDDDGLLSKAVEETNNILNETGLDAVNMNPDPDAYFWPNYLNSNHANLLKVSFEQGYKIYKSSKELRRVMNCATEYGVLPSLYNSFISLRAINELKKTNTAFFRSRIPDVYSGVALASAIDSFVSTRRRLRLTGASSHSTGASQMSKDKTAATKFLKEDNIPFHPSIQFCHSYSYLIAESFLQSFDAGLNKEEQKIFDFTPFIKTAIKEATLKLRHQREEIIDATRYIVQHNGLDAEKIELLIQGSQSRWVNTIGYDIKKYLHPFMLFDASEYGVTNIYDACQLHQKIHDNPAKYLAKVSTWANLKRLL
jgi:glycosyltransferase involved in cell wall biosynthesis